MQSRRIDDRKNSMHRLEAERCCMDINLPGLCELLKKSRFKLPVFGVEKKTDLSECVWASEWKESSDQKPDFDIVQVYTCDVFSNEQKQSDEEEVRCSRFATCEEGSVRVREQLQFCRQCLIINDVRNPKEQLLDCCMDCAKLSLVNLECLRKNEMLENPELFTRSLREQLRYISSRIDGFNLQTVWRQEASCVLFTMDTKEHTGNSSGLEESVRKLKCLLEHVVKLHPIVVLFGLIDVQWRWVHSGQLCHDVYMHNTECDIAMRNANKYNSNLRGAYHKENTQTFPQLLPKHFRQQDTKTSAVIRPMSFWTKRMLQHYDGVIQRGIHSIEQNLIKEFRCIVTMVDANVLHTSFDDGGAAPYDSKRYSFGTLWV